MRETARRGGGIRVRKSLIYNYLEAGIRGRHMGCTRGASRFPILGTGAQDSDTGRETRSGSR